MEVIKAKDFPPNFTWFNTDESLSLSRLKGYVVVLDFWTYCCINCMHMIGELARLEHKYRDKPVVFIGVHSAKFFNEQDVKNIEQAIYRYEIEHPVVVDEDMAIWRAYNVNAWPTIVIIDPLGNVVYRRSGEGQSELIEDVIDVLLSRYTGKVATEPMRYKPSSRGTNDRLYYPGKVALDAEYRYIAVTDSNNNRVLIVRLSDGRVIHKIGDGMKGLVDGSIDEARFFRPQGIRWSKDDDIIYITDTENHAIRAIDLDSKKVTTIAGNGRQGYYSKGGYAKDVQLNSPWDLDIDGDKLYVAMAGLHQIWLYRIEDSIIRPFAGSGYEGIYDSDLGTAEFAQPSGLSLHKGILYVADSESSSIRAIDISGRRVKTIVGRDLFVFGYKDGSVYDALLQHPLGVDAYKDSIYIADTYNHAIRAIDINTRQIRTIIGRKEGVECRLDDSCMLMLYEPSDVKYNPNDDRLYIADTNNHMIRVYDKESKILSTMKIVLF